MNPTARALLVAAALAGFSGVALAAIGAHAVQGNDVFATWRSWQSASAMHLLHAPALLALAALAAHHRSRLWLASGALMVAGLLLFSGSIYYSILSGHGGTGGLAPIGGFSLMLAWLLLVVAAFSARRPGGTA